MIEPIPYFCKIINRNAIVVKPKKPLLDWINFLYPDPENPVTQVEGDIYLIQEMDSTEEIEKWLKRNFDQIFQNELNDWHTDEKNWPQKRTFKIFQEWFEYRIHYMVLDLGETDIIKIK